MKLYGYYSFCFLWKFIINSAWCINYIVFSFQLQLSRLDNTIEVISIFRDCLLIKFHICLICISLLHFITIDEIMLLNEWPESSLNTRLAILLYSSISIIDMYIIWCCGIIRFSCYKLYTQSCRYWKLEL